jgi:hypothetical protein
VSQTGLQGAANCNLFGWGGASINPRNDAVGILSPESCDARYPQVFCSNFASLDHKTCSARLGSPVICSNGFIAGFSLNSGNCVADNERALVRFLTIHEFIPWMQEVLGGGSIPPPSTDPPDSNTDAPSQDSSRFIIDVVHFITIDSPRVRCSGTIISPNHVLTAASCVIVEDPFRVGVLAGLRNGFHTSESSTDGD